MFNFISSLIQLVIVLLAIFFETTKEREGGWRGRTLARFGRILILGSILVFLLSAGTEYLTQYQKGKVVSVELKLACNHFLNGFFVPYTMSVIEENTSTANFKPNLDQDQKDKAFIEYIWFDGGDIETLIKNGTTKRLFEANLHFDIPGYGIFNRCSNRSAMNLDLRWRT